MLVGLAHGACGDAPRTDRRIALATLDPRLATDAGSTRIGRLLFRAPVDLDEHSRPAPGLARWTSPSPALDRFALGGQGRRLPDGTPLIARDVAATCRSLLDPHYGAPRRTGLPVIERIETPDEATVEFHLRHPDPLFPSRLTIGVVPEPHLAAGHPIGCQPVGSGPFALEDWPDGRAA